MINGFPESNINLSLTAASLASLSSPSILFEFEFFILSCSIGNILKLDYECYQCPNSSFSLLNPILTPLHLQKCLKCPKNAICMEGYKLIPLPGLIYTLIFFKNYIKFFIGFYKLNNFSKSVIPCLAKQACKSDGCSDGNIGRLCSECLDGWAKNSREEVCVKCELFGTLSKLLTIGVVIIAYILLIFSTAEGGNLQSKQKKNETKGYLKILTNHLQQMTVIFNRNHLLGFDSELMFQITDTFSFSDDTVYSNDCLLEMLYDSSSKIKTKYFLKSLIISMFPFLFGGVSFLLWNLYKTLRKSSIFLKNVKFIERIKVIVNRLLLLFVISIFLFYTAIIKFNFKIFNCMFIDDEIPQTFLIDDLNIECWSLLHFENYLVFGFLLIILWSCVFPYLLFRLLKKVHYIKQETMKGKEISNDNFLRNVGSFDFFYIDYKQKYYFWEITIFIRKFLIYLICSFNDTLYSEVKQVSLMILLFLCFLITLNCAPFQKNVINKIELFSIVVLIYSNAVSFIILTGSMPDYVIAIIIILFLGSNFLFILSIVVNLMKDFLLRRKKAKNLVKAKN